jgi:hypothetical protein
VTDDERVAHGVSRRTMLKRVGAAGAIAWVTPVVTSLTTPAFAASEDPHPECREASCGNFLSCSSGNPDCVCVSTDQGGFCIPGSTACASLAPCASGLSSECSGGAVCASNTCCGAPVCVPVALTGSCPPGGGEGFRTTGRPSTGAGTIGG